MSSSSCRIKCDTLDQARHVVSLLRSRNIPNRNIRVFSAEPIHDVGEAISGKSRLGAFLLSGAFIGAIAGFALAAVTARLYPLDTGGMPIVSALPVGIVTYEAMMLVAVVFSVIGLILEARLLRRVAPEFHSHAREITDGEIHVVAEVASNEVAEDLRIQVDSGRYGIET